MAKLTDAELAQKILELSGGPNNIVNAANCMTRLRLVVKQARHVKVEEIKKIMGVMTVLAEGETVQVVLGPGKARRVAEEFNQLLSLSIQVKEEIVHSEDRPPKPEFTGNGFVRFWKNIGFFFKTIRWKKGFRHIGNIFSPLVPGFIIFGITFSISCIILMCCCADRTKLDPSTLIGAPKVFYWIFMAFSKGFLGFLAVFVGINAAKEFKVTPVIGGIIGGISIFPDIYRIAEELGWIQGWKPDGTVAHYIIEAGSGGVLAVILAVFLIGYLERFIRKHMPSVLDNVVSPLLTVVIGGSIFIFAIMPAMGYVTKGITMGVNFLSSPAIHVALRALIGFVLGALFLPLVMLGLHRGLDALYLEMMAQEPFRGINIYPVFAMADASQAGVGLALYFKGKKCKHQRVKENAGAGVIPQVLGVSEPLIYGVTLPLVKPFITVGIGAGIAGAFIMAMGVGSSAFAASGLLAIPMMIYLNGVVNPMAMVVYVGGWAIAAVCGFISTWFLIKEKDLDRMPRN